MHINRPGLMLAGHKEDFAAKRIQIMGKSEMGFCTQTTNMWTAFSQAKYPV